MNQTDAVCFRCDTKGSFEALTGAQSWRKVVRCTNCKHWHHADTMQPFEVRWTRSNPCCARANGSYCEKHGYSDSMCG